MAKRQLYTLEFPIRCTTNVLYNLLSTSAGLTEWFAEKVDSKEHYFYFTWEEGNVEMAEQIATVQDTSVRYRWEWMDENEYFEFRIEKSTITSGIILWVEDFCEPGEEDDQENLWESQIDTLRRRLGN